MEFKLPELGEGVHEGELVKWKIKVGETIKHDQSLCEIMTDKATMEIPSPFSGKVQSLHAKEGEIVKVGQMLVILEGGGKSASAPAQAAVAAPTPAPTNSQPVAMAMSTLSPATRVLAAPVTRRAARELGIDLATVSGSGPHGRVMREDLQKSGSSQSAVGASAAGAPSFRPAPLKSPAAANSEDKIPFRGLRKKIAEKMRLSKDKAAHFTYVEEADATEIVKLRAQAKEIGAKSGIKVTYLPFIMKAMVAALRKHPMLNSTLDEASNEIIVKHYYNISMSIQTDDGLTAPVIKNVESKSILQLAQEIQNLVERARQKKLTLEDFQGGTITLTNAGSIGGLWTTPVINFPEVAILGFNKIFRKPVVKVIKGQEKIVIRDWTYFSISLDHRIVDGAEAAEFMKTFIQYVESPTLLVMESL
jgi:pyruvate dehydrogenase E2 component (dihydrolipoamide acetyltransferase)